MSRWTIFFQANPKDLPAAEYLKIQDTWQRAQLEKFVLELESGQKIDHPDARYLGDDKWSLWIRPPGKDAINHVCYLALKAADEFSSTANLILDPSATPNQTMRSSRKKRLVIIGESHRPGEDPSSSERDPESYSSLMDKIQAQTFLEVISAIRNGLPSPYYTDLGNGTYRIHIDRPELAYGIHIHCTARWAA